MELKKCGLQLKENGIYKENEIREKEFECKKD